MLSIRARSPLQFSRFTKLNRTISTHSDVLHRLGISTSTPNAGVYNGEWKATGSTYASINPSTGKVLAEVREASKQDVEETMIASREAFKVWRKVPAPKRGEILRLIRGALNEKIDGQFNV